MPRRNKTEEKPAGAPEWMTTYGDMVTLLLTFFILLFSFSSIDANKWKALVKTMTGTGISIEESTSVKKLGGNASVDTSKSVNKPYETEPSDDTKTEDMKTDSFDELYKKIKDYVEKNKLEAQINIERSETEIIIRFKENVLFDSGKADLKDEAQKILGDISVVLKESQDQIKIIRAEGHTDNIPIKTSSFPTNWELSTARAVQVIRFFIEKRGLDPRKLSAVGYGEYHPIKDNNTAENRARNRRVDLVIAKSIAH